MVGSYSCGKQEGVGTGTLPGSPPGLCSQLGRNCLTQALGYSVSPRDTDQRGKRHFQGCGVGGGGGGGGVVTLGGPGRPRYSRTPAGAARMPAPPLRSALGRTPPAPSSASGGERAEGTPGRARQRQRRGVREEFGTHPLPRPAGKLRPGVEEGAGLGPGGERARPGRGVLGVARGP